jgi:hypothetical protein
MGGARERQKHCRDTVGTAACGREWGRCYYDNWIIIIIIIIIVIVIDGDTAHPCSG